MKPILASIVGINPLSKPTLRKHPLLEPIHQCPASSAAPKVSAAPWLEGSKRLLGTSSKRRHHGQKRPRRTRDPPLPGKQPGADVRPHSTPHRGALGLHDPWLGSSSSSLGLLIETVHSFLPPSKGKEGPYYSLSNLICPTRTTCQLPYQHLFAHVLLVSIPSLTIPCQSQNFPGGNFNLERQRRIEPRCRSSNDFMRCEMTSMEPKMFPSRKQSMRTAKVKSSRWIPLGPPRGRITCL